jgi:hypothetical protein
MDISIYRDSSAMNVTLENPSPLPSTTELRVRSPISFLNHAVLLLLPVLQLQHRDNFALILDISLLLLHVFRLPLHSFLEVVDDNFLLLDDSFLFCQLYGLRRGVILKHLIGRTRRNIASPFIIGGAEFYARDTSSEEEKGRYADDGQVCAKGQGGLCVKPLSGLVSLTSDWDGLGKRTPEELDEGVHFG